MKKQLLFGLCMGAALALGGCGNDAGQSPSTSKCEDSKCPEGQHCVDGACADVEVTDTCEDSAQKLCGETCKDVQNDVANCGDCGHACEEGETCEGGACKAPEACADAAEVRCDGVCTNVKTDARNCGDCGNGCGVDAICEDGACKLSCKDGWKVCDEACTEVQTDSRNCGDCGNVCSGGAVCVDGACKLSCSDTQVECKNNCDGADEDCAPSLCVDLKTDAANCGECGKACKEGLFCVNGVCGVSCTSSQTACGEECVNLKTDAANCGECNHACENGDVCRQGVCEPFCPQGQEECDGQCYDLQSTFSHCAECGHACEEGQFCNGGQCLQDCGEGRIGCDGNCIEANSDTNYCGAKGSCSEDSLESANSKGVKCDGGQVCRDGACVCDAEGQTACLVAENTHLCTDASKDDAYCGCNAEGAGLNCGTLENAQEGHCEESVCKFECKEGFASCDDEAANGCEVNLNDDVENCGACGNPCLAENASEISCKFGECVPTCNEGFVACGGKCVSLKSDENCGACGNACGEGAFCSEEGFCVVKECTLEDGDYAAVKVGDKTVKAYCIRDIANFKEVRSSINLGQPYPDDKNTDNAYILMKNISLGEQASWAGMGSEAKPFTGYYFGNGKTVSGKLTCASDYCGIIGYAKSSVMRDFNLDVTVTQSGNRNYIGGFAGYTEDSKISNMTITGAVTGYQYVGGLVGYAKTTEITSVHSKMNISGDQLASGGIVGQADFAKLDDCHANCEVTHVYKHSGGLVGNAYDSEFTNSTSNSNATITGDYGGCWHVGTFVGYSQRSSFKNCRSQGNSKARAGVGGFAGRADNSKFENCVFEKGIVTTPTKFYGNSFGGFVGNGLTSEYKNCSANADVDGGTEVGGFSSWTQGGKFENCTAEGTVKGNQAYVGGFVGYVTASSSFKNCSTKSEVTSTNTMSGGFAGVSYSSSFEGCKATGNATGTQYVGGHTGYADNSTFTDCHATGNVNNNNSTGNGFGGFVGYLNNSTITGSTAAGSVTGYKWSSAFAGMVRGTVKLIKCASFGSVKSCNNACNAGGLIGGLSGTVTIDTSFSTANENGWWSGGFVGDAEGGTVLIADSYCTGNVVGAGKQGAIVGNQGGVVTLKDVFWWQGGNPNPGTAAFGANSTHTPFIYKESKAVVAENNDAPLADMLNVENDNWASQTCMLSTGPGTANVSKYVIPILKGMKVSFCE